MPKAMLNAMEDHSHLIFPVSTDPWSLLSAEQIRKSIGIRDYMLGEGRLNPDPDVTLTTLSERFVDAGLPLDRCVTIVRILHSINTASFRSWERGKGTNSGVFEHTPTSTDAYDNSPSALAHKTCQWVRFNPQKTPETTFNIVPELQEAGVTDYICAPTLMVNRMQNVFTFATRATNGFSDGDVAVLQAAFPAIEACQEILVMHRILREVTRMYVGEEPHKRILAGDVHRGEVTRMEAAILFADMRDFTGLTSQMTAQDATALLNDYYDCIVPAVETNGGEVLKFIGDGILAMFRAHDDGAKASAAALNAAKTGLDAVDQRNLEGTPKYQVGIALHFGEVAYGNIGSGERLDYTVIGRDVNLAARVAGLCGSLDEALLVSSKFRQLHSGRNFSACGTHNLKGLAEPEQIYRPNELQPPSTIAQ